MKPQRAVVLALCAVALIGCVDAPVDDEVPPPTAPVDDDPEPAAPCGHDSDVYSPYTSAAHPTSTAASLPWHGVQTTYPATVEDFRGYGTSSARVECSSDKSQRSHLDVTAGCLNVVSGARGEIVSTSAGAFRAIALGFADHDTAHAVRWTDQRVEYRFHYTRASGAGVLPGFKAFARYNSEDDLYVASWRLDGVVQIQRKQCGVYTALKIVDNFGAPTPNTWHTLRFDAIGDRLELYLDGKLVISVVDRAFTSGTAGIRTDAMTGALIDDWRVSL